MTCYHNNKTLSIFWIAGTALLLVVVSTTTTTEAWVQQQQPPFITSRTCSTSGRTRTTALGMFDWFNPKPATTTGSTATKEEEKKDEEEKATGDFLGNFFNQPTTTTEEKEKEEAKPTEEEETNKIVVEAEPVVAVVAETTTTAKEESHSSTTDTAAAATSTTSIHTGTVKWYNPRKGFGFIASAGSGDGDEQVFVHQSEIQAPGFRTLVEGEVVEYRLDQDEQGRRRAIHVTGPNGGDVTITLRRKARMEE